MSVLTNERQALERERAELPAHVANYQRELSVTPPANRERRDGLEWLIRRAEKRIAEIHARLTALVLIALTILAGCSSVQVLPTYTQDELRADCDRHRGWWRPDDLRGGYCEYDSHL